MLTKRSCYPNESNKPYGFRHLESLLNNAESASFSNVQCLRPVFPKCSDRFTGLGNFNSPIEKITNNVSLQMKLVTSNNQFIAPFGSQAPQGIIKNAFRALYEEAKIKQQRNKKIKTYNCWAEEP